MNPRSPYDANPRFLPKPRKPRRRKSLFREVCLRLAAFFLTLADTRMK